MGIRIRNEARRFVQALKELDLQTATVLILATVLAIAQYKYGTRLFFREKLTSLHNLARPGAAAGDLGPFIYHTSWTNGPNGGIARHMEIDGLM